jgi:hypothetical protein
VRLGGSGKLGELFKVKTDVSKMRLAALAPTNADARSFLKVGLRGLETHHIFLHSP